MTNNNNKKSKEKDNTGLLLLLLIPASLGLGFLLGKSTCKPSPLDLDISNYTAEVTN